MTTTLTPTGLDCLRAIARGRPPGDQNARTLANVLVGAGLASYSRGVYTITEAGEACLAAHEAQPDITLTFTQRLALRRLLDGQPLADVDLDAVIGPLVGAGLVGHDGVYWLLTDDGRAYLAAHDEARTRRTDRPGPPKVPDGWRPFGARVDHDGADGWVYEGRLTDTIVEEVDPEELEADIEAAEARVALLHYLRALRAYQSREARDGAPVAPSAEPEKADDGDGMGRPGELPFASEVSP